MTLVAGSLFSLEFHAIVNPDISVRASIKEKPTTIRLCTKYRRDKLALAPKALSVGLTARKGLHS